MTVGELKKAIEKSGISDDGYVVIHHELSEFNVDEVCRPEVGIKPNMHPGNTLVIISMGDY